MASIHLYKDRSPYYLAKFLGDDGKPKFKTTKQTDRRKALTLALEWERQAQKARQGVITEAQCRKVLSEMLERVTGETLRADTVEDFLTRWLKGKENAKAEGTYLRYGNTVKLFVAGLGKKAKLPLAGVVPKDIEKFQQAQLGAGKAMSTVNVDLKTLRTAFNTARRQGLIPANPVDAVELPEETRHERKSFTTEQVAALVKTATGEWKTAILVGYYLGARLGDAVSLTWEDITLTGNQKSITYTQEKTGRELEVPIHPEFETHLLTLAGDDPKAFLTPTLATQEIGGRNGLSRQFKDIMKKAGVDDGRIEKPERAADDENAEADKGRAFSTYSFHSLRVSFISALAKEGVAKELRMKLSGHQSDKVHDRYTKLEYEPLAKAIGQLPSLGN